MSVTRTRTNRPALACDGRQHVDGEHECRQRFWSPSRDHTSYPYGVESGDLRLRASSRGWWCGQRNGQPIDMCPYHAPEPAKERPMSNDDPKLHVPAEMLRDFRIGEIWAAIGVDPSDNSEGVLYWRHRNDPIPKPLIAADAYALASIRSILPEVAKTYRHAVKLVRFSVREDIETFEPGPTSSVLWTP